MCSLNWLDGNFPDAPSPALPVSTSSTYLLSLQYRPLVVTSILYPVHLHSCLDTPPPVSIFLRYPPYPESTSSCFNLSFVSASLPEQHPPVSLFSYMFLCTCAHTHLLFKSTSYIPTPYQPPLARTFLLYPLFFCVDLPTFPCLRPILSSVPTLMNPPLSCFYLSPLSAFILYPSSHVSTFLLCRPPTPPPLLTL